MSQIAFALLVLTAAFFIYKRYQFVRGNILLGQPSGPTDRKDERLRTMLRVALGRGKMFTRPFAAFLHVIVYVGFIIINIECHPYY